MSLIRKLIIFLCLFPVTSWAGDTINCDNCTQAEVASKIASASATDTVVIPIGNCEWSSGVTIDKQITLKGSGSSSTIITQDEGQPTLITSTADGTIIKDLCLQGPGGSSYLLEIKGNDWRVTGDRFASTVSGDKLRGVYVNSTTGYLDSTGLIDDCEFVEAQVLVYGAPLDETQNDVWNLAMGLGGADAVYVENCTFTSNSFGNIFDSNRGGSYVVRYCTITQSHTSGSVFEAHSVQATNARAAKKWEIYNNLITGTSALYFARLRGGTGVIFNNKLQGTWDNENVLFDNRRCTEDFGQGKCDGTTAGWDGNDVGVGNGWPCRDQIGRGSDDPVWVFDAGEGDPSAWAQGSESSYIWNNTASGGGTLPVAVDAGSAAWIVEDRDYYLSQKPGYSAYQCPHPLTGLSGTCSPSMAGRAGYNLSSGITGIGSGGSATTGGSGTITLTSP